MSTELEGFFSRLLEALLNGVFQGMLVAGLLWVAIKMMRGLNAATRHAIAFGGIVIVAALPLGHLGQTLWSEVRSRTTPAPIATVAALESFVPVPIEEIVIAPASTSLAVGRTEWELALPSFVATAAILCWIAIGMLRLAGLARQCLSLRKIKRNAVPSMPVLRERFEELRQAMLVRRPTRLGLSEEVRTPLAAGFARPMVILPSALEREPAAHLDAILRHELAHIRRWDDWTNLAQQTIRSLFFFHPGVWWLSNRLNLDREIACDDHALACLENRREYALLLTEFATRMRSQDWVAAPGGWSKRNQLRERIAMIMNAHRNKSTQLAGARAGMLTIGAALVALFVMQAGPRVALANEPAVAPAEAAAPASPAPPAPSAAAAPAGIIVSGPKSKGPAAGNPNEIASVIVQPVPHADPLPSPAPYVAAADVHVRPPQPGPAPKPVRVTVPDRDLEKRLERLERMVESLSRQKGEGKHESHFEFQHEFKPDFKAEFKREFKGEFKHPELDAKFHQDIAKMESDLREKMKKQEWKLMEDEARRAGELARKEGERAARETKRAMQEMERQRQNQSHGEINARRKALEGHRKALEKQLQEIERQIDDIEEERERQEEQKEQERDRHEADRERQQAEKERQQADRERQHAEREKAEQDREKAKRESQSENNPNENNDSAPKKRK